MTICITPASDRRKTFWTTQEDGCGSFQDCLGECGIPGLQFTRDSENSDGTNSIVNTDWIKSLLLNILYTNGRKPDTPCGYTPRGIGGHWSESFSQYGASFGTLMRDVPPTGRIQEGIALVTAEVIAAANKLVTYGVAESVTVDSTYLGNLQVQLDINIYGFGGDMTNVGLTGQRLTNGWVWN